MVQTRKSRSAATGIGLAVAFVLASAGGCATGIFARTPARGSPTPQLNEPGWVTVPDLAFIPQQARSDCGAAALAMVLGRWGRNIDPAAMHARTGPIDDKAGIPAGKLRTIVRNEGLNAYLVSATFDDLAYELENGRPVLVGVIRKVGTRGYPHYAVVSGINRAQRRLLTADPADGWKRQDWDDFEASWRFSRHLALVAWP